MKKIVYRIVSIVSKEVATYYREGWYEANCENIKVIEGYHGEYDTMEEALAAMLELDEGYGETYTVIPVVVTIEK